MVAAVARKRLASQSPHVSEFEADVLEGLRVVPKHVPAKYFYDSAGSQLFERITELPEYYPTRCEISILRSHGADIAKFIPSGAALVEFGSGSSKKARILLSAAPKLAAYVPVDICGEMIEQEAVELRTDFPDLKVLPVTADICKPFELPEEAKRAPVLIGFFPGSTIGNFEPHEASAFLRNAASILGCGAILIIGADLIKPADVLNAAYNDAQGVTAQFNLNLLTRINRELGGTFPRAPSAFDVRTSRVLQPRTSSRRNAPREPQATEGKGGRRDDRISYRRDHSYREQLQIQR